MVIRLGVIILGSICLSAHSAGAQVRALADSDVAVNGVAYGMDSASVRAKLGRPASRKTGEWIYPGVKIYLVGGHVTQIHITGAGFATAKGLRIGDSLQRVDSLYGHTCYDGSHTFCFQKSLDGDFDERGIIVEFNSHDQVSRIIVGAVFET